jgi:hypothetical protein
MINNKIIEPVKNLSNLGCDTRISYEYDDDPENKLHKFMCGNFYGEWLATFHYSQRIA